MVTTIDNKRGSDCTGSEGATSRTLTLDNSGDNNTIFSITVQNNALNTGDYSHNASTNVVTFNNEIYDIFYIDVLYQYDSASVDSATYANITQLKNFMGLNSTDTTFSDDQLQDALDRSESKINNETNTSWLNGTLTTPSYTQVTEEKHRGKGAYNRDYFTDKFPLANVSTLLNGDVAADDETITVDSTQGFSTSGSIFIGNDKITYTGKTTTTFTGCTSVSAHDDDDKVNSYGVELSTSCAGSDPVWTPLAELTEFDLAYEEARFHVYTDQWIADPYGSDNPPKIPNRLRLTYLAGHTTIPDDIEWLCLAFSSRDLMKASVRKSHATGLNDYNPERLDVDSKEIDRILNRYRSWQMSNI